MTVAIDDITAKIMSNRQKDSDLSAAIAGSQGQLEQLTTELGNLQDTINYLRGQITQANEDLRRAYSNGNDANTAVAFAKENLDAVNKRWQDESKIENDATLNLERARAEEALAKLALDEIIAKYSDALPYAIVPNGNGVGAGSPTGNNPSGSPLGAATQGTEAFAVQDWSSYLSRAFGSGINPAFDGNVNALYPMNFQFTNGLRGAGNGANVCGAAGPVRAVSGNVIAIAGSSFTIRTQGGQQYEVNVAPCSQLSANHQGHYLSVGD